MQNSLYCLFVESDNFWFYHLREERVRWWKAMDSAVFVATVAMDSAAFLATLPVSQKF